MLLAAAIYRGPASL